MPKSAMFGYERRFLISFAEAILGLDAAGHPDAPAAIDRLDRFLAEAGRSLRTNFHLALLVMPPGLLPGIWLKLVFPTWTLERRRRYLDQLFRRNLNRPPGMFIDSQAILGTVKSMVSGAYCETASVWRRLGYRARVEKFPAPNGKPVIPPSGPDLDPATPSAVGQKLQARRTSLAAIPPRDPAVPTVIVIGGGAAGIATVNALTESAWGRSARVILLEAGPLKVNSEFPRTTLDGFTQLYVNSGVTPNRSQRIGFIQGRCVGGGSTVNNAGSPRPYGPWRLAMERRWGNEGADLDWVELDQCFDDLEGPLNITQVPDWLPTPGTNRAFAGQLKLPGPWKRGLLNANLLNCVGCGQCNQGCAYDAHRTPLITLLPEALGRNPNLMLVPDVTVTKLRFGSRGNGRTVTGVDVVDPAGGHRTLEADKIILTAGAFASTGLLLQSGFTSSTNRYRLVGQRFSCNYASPVLGRFAEPQYAGRGIQIGYIMEVPELKLIIETAFAPPTVMGMMLPHTGLEFQKKLDAFDYYGVSFPTLSSDGYGSIDFSMMSPGSAEIAFDLGARDLDRLRWGLATCAESMRLAGAVELFDSRFSGETVPLTGNEPEDRARISRYYDGFGPHTYVKVQSAHLQGGNVIHRDPTRGVVDNDLKVHGVDNLWVFDSSVFPAPITLNIQYTTMALARYAARRLVP